MASFREDATYLVCQTGAMKSLVHCSHVHTITVFLLYAPCFSVAEHGVLRSALEATPHGDADEHGSASAFLSRVSSPHFADEETAARQKFIMKCTVVMSTRGRDMLPWQQVDHVCSMTDNVFDCKADLTDRFKNANRDGGTMINVCAAAYAWFEKRYGKFCPSQCSKLQCRPTCAWLEEKKRQDQIGKTLAEERRKAGALADGSAELDFKLQKKMLEVKGQIAKNKTAAAQLQRAAASVKEKNAALERALAAENKAQKDLTAWEKKLTDLRQERDKAKEALDEARRLDDKAGMQGQLGNKAKERINKKIVDKDAELKKAKSAIEPVEKELKPLEEEYKFMWEPTVKQAKDDVDKAEKAAAERTKERKEAEAKLKKLGYSPVLEDLVKQKRSMEQKALKFLSDKKSGYRLMKMSADEVKKTIEDKKKEISKLTGKVETIEKNKAQLKEELKQEDKKVAVKGASRAETAEKLKKAEAAYKLIVNKVGEQEHVLSYWVKNLNEHKEASSKARKASANAEKAFKLENFGVDKQIRDAGKAVKVEQELEKVVKAAKAEVANKRKSLEEKLAAHNKAMKDLEARKPDIVKMHGLGLILKLGF